ncbi:MAG: hypothetical protein MZW92_76720 [Comamonadaceae bacterium]|nr:hypothetical protein [Comamonadaceae bacterium]
MIERVQDALETPDKTMAPPKTEGPRPRTRCAAGRRISEDEPQRAATDAAPSTALQPGKYQPRTRMDAGLAERAGRLASRRRASCSRSWCARWQAGRRGSLRDHRRRAALARGAASPA